jgi:hypothetical protein
MKKIWKFRLHPTQPVMVPIGATILSVGNQSDDIYMWALVDPDAVQEPVRPVIVGTGHEVPADAGPFIGTVILHDGALVLHVFHRIQERKRIV